MHKRVLEIAADVFQVPASTLGPDSTPESVGTWDSLRHLSFVLALEEEFHLQFLPEDIEQMLTIGLTAELVQEKLQSSLVSNEP